MCVSYLDTERIPTLAYGLPYPHNTGLAEVMHIHSRYAFSVEEIRTQKLGDDYDLYSMAQWRVVTQCLRSLPSNRLLVQQINVARLTTQTYHVTPDIHSCHSQRVWTHRKT